jgi:hypothetical protein
MATSSQLVKAVNGGFVDSSQVSEFAGSLYQSPMSSDTAATTEPDSKVTSPATQTVGRRSTWAKKRSAAVVENDMLMAEKVLAIALTAAGSKTWSLGFPPGNMKLRKIPFPHHSPC